MQNTLHPAIGEKPFDPNQVFTTEDIGIHREFLLTKVTADSSELEEAIKPYDLPLISRMFGHVPFYRNILTSAWEYATGATVLHSYPWDICVPIADTCNARCSFCTSWLEGSKIMKLEEFDRFETLFRFARTVGLAGHGEPLAHPNIDSMLARLQDWLHPAASCYVITNGVYLEGRIESLIASKLKTFAISLNAATEATHQTVMGLKEGAFPKIIDSIKELVARRDTGDITSISISLVVTRQNLHEVAKFVEMGNELRVDKIQLKTLAGAGGTIPGLNYHQLPPYDHPDYARLKSDAEAAVTASGVLCQVDLASWDTPVFTQEALESFQTAPPEILDRSAAMNDPSTRGFWRGQEKYENPAYGAYHYYADDFDGNNPYGRSARLGCRAPYYFMYINDFSYSMVPCCYMNKTPGYLHTTYDGTTPFFDSWNSPGMVELRNRLRHGPLFNMCTKCPSTY